MGTDRQREAKCLSNQCEMVGTHSNHCGDDRTFEHGVRGAVMTKPGVVGLQHESLDVFRVVLLVTTGPGIASPVTTVVFVRTGVVAVPPRVLPRPHRPPPPTPVFLAFWEVLGSSRRSYEALGSPRKSYAVRGSRSFLSES